MKKVDTCAEVRLWLKDTTKCLQVAKAEMAFETIKWNKYKGARLGSNNSCQAEEDRLWWWTGWSWHSCGKGNSPALASGEKVQQGQISPQKSLGILPPTFFLWAERRKIHLPTCQWCLLSVRGSRKCCRQNQNQDKGVHLTGLKYTLVEAQRSLTVFR